MPEAPATALDLIDLGKVADGSGEGGGDSDAASGSGGGTGRGAGEGAGSGKVGGWQRVNWIQKPRPDQWRSVWPKGPLRMGKGGLVVLICTVPRPGPPRRCFVATEQPTGLGFGAAAVSLSRLDTFRIRPVRSPDGGWSRIPIAVPIVFGDAPPQKPATSAAAAPPAPPLP